MACCGGTCCGGRPWGLLAVALAAAGAGGIMFMARDAGAGAAGGRPVTAVAGQPASGAGPEEADVTKDPAYILGFTMRRIDGTEQDLGEYRGKVVVLVNVASKCGMTPQYAGLERLYEEKRDAGLVVLGFPANDFRGQEPGTNEEIAAFCATEYGVTFPMFEKISVTGEGQHPLYRRLAALPEPLGGGPKWNFTKFIADRSGRVVARFEPKVAPDDPRFVEKIEALLAER